MQTPDCPLVDASPDAHDEEGFDAVIRVWKQAEAEAEVEADSPNVRRKLRKQKAEVRFLHEEETLSANTRAKHAARAYERVVSREHEDEPDFFDWNSNRALDRQDFDYLFFHRQRSTKKIRTWLEIIASKIVHINEDGEPGYFNKLERNIGWTDYIAPLLFTGAEITDIGLCC